MNFPFDGERGLILVNVEVFGPVGSAYLVLALDTGATSTLINVERLVSIGYDPAASADRQRIVTGSGLEYVARLPVDRITALGMERSDFPMVAHTLPPATGIDGLLGLDFFRGKSLRTDFAKGIVEIS